jgi:hypothetical protein
MKWLLFSLACLAHRAHATETHDVKFDFNLAAVIGTTVNCTLF